MAELQAELRTALAELELDELEEHDLQASYPGLPPKAGFDTIRAPFVFGWTASRGPSDIQGPMARAGTIDDPRTYTINRCVVVGFISSDEGNLAALEQEAAEKWMDLYLAALLAHRNLGRDDCTVSVVWQESQRTNIYGRDCWAVRNRVVIEADDDVEVGN